MRTPQRRDISARQDLLGKELRQLFDDFTQEDVPDELMRLAMQLQGAVATRGEASAAPVPAAAKPATDAASEDVPPAASATKDSG